MSKILTVFFSMTGETYANGGIVDLEKGYTHIAAEYIIRRFNDKDAASVSNMIATTLRTTNIKDYTAEYARQDRCVLIEGGMTALFLMCTNHSARLFVA